MLSGEDKARSLRPSRVGETGRKVGNPSCPDPFALEEKEKKGNRVRGISLATEKGKRKKNGVSVLGICRSKSVEDKLKREET